MFIIWEKMHLYNTFRFKDIQETTTDESAKSTLITTKSLQNSVNTWQTQECDRTGNSI